LMAQMDAVKFTDGKPDPISIDVLQPGYMLHRVSLRCEEYFSWLPLLVFFNDL
jgi:hypothetical protein